MHSKFARLLLTSTAASLALYASAAGARNFNIPGGDLERALDAYTTQTGVSLIVSDDLVKGIRSNGANGDLSDRDALSKLLSGTGFIVHPHSNGAIAIVPGTHTANEPAPLELAQAAPTSRGSAVETVTVTSSKLGGTDVQSIPISITALSQDQLTSSQTAGGPDLIKQVPNMTFTKTNFSGYSIQIRGIGTQAISVTTDPAVAVAFNDTPFIRNHFFEQEFYDVAQVEVLRGPQGTLYGRNATAGVVNLTSAKPTDQFEAMASGEFGNYAQKRFEGMINIPISDDYLDVRLAGEWTKRNGYSFNEYNNQSIDGRDLWSGRLSIGWHPTESLQAYLIWEHFSENDDRLRSGKQLCTTAPTPLSVGGQPIPQGSENAGLFSGLTSYLSQGCQMGSLYGSSAYGIPNGLSLPYYTIMNWYGAIPNANPYSDDRQTPDLRAINTQLTPTYKANNDTVEFNTDYQITPALTLTSETGFNRDFLWSTEDYNRFPSTQGLLTKLVPSNWLNADGAFCDPQLGCSTGILAEDLSEEHSWQASQELRLASHFTGPLNFSVGGNFLHYETEENYYVFINTLTVYTYGENNAAGLNLPWIPGVSDGSDCIKTVGGGFRYRDPSLGGGTQGFQGCAYVDPNPIGSLNNNGHNYFLSQNPYTLNSYAAFGEAYYDIFKNLKLTTGLRWTEDQKHFVDIPSQLASQGWGYPPTDVIDQQWDAISGRAALNWTPVLDFTDQTLVYGSYAHGYKAGGANPPGPILPSFAPGDADPVHPLIFKPEFIDAFELGTKNTLFDGALTLNGSVFYYNYEDYQISEIVDRTAINLNFDAHVKGAEVEATWEPIPGLRFNASGGYEDARAANGQGAIDLIDRTNGNPDWVVVRPFPTQAANCILPAYVIAAVLEQRSGYQPGITQQNGNNSLFMCAHAYALGLDPVTQVSFQDHPSVTFDPTDPFLTVPAGYAGFDPLGPTATNNGAGPAPNLGEGFTKDVSHHTLPNAPPFTFSAGAQYTMPITQDWAGTLRADFYWQNDSWARIFNDDPYDRLHGYSNLNLTVILTSQEGWQVMGYMKNVMNTTAITGAFLNSDDSNLTTNVFLTDPRLIGLRVTKNW
jgi:outer membrane receptor protein involved in Fe transport